MVRSCIHGASVLMLGMGLLGFVGQHVTAGDKKPVDKGTPKKEPPKGMTGKTILDVKGELTVKDERDPDPQAKECYCKTFPIKLQDGKTYQIDLRSTDFDAFLTLRDAAGAKVASDDDGGGGLDARITHKATKTGEYKIYASSFKANEVGKFTLTVLEGGDDKIAAAPPGKPIPLKLVGLSLKVDGTLAGTDATDRDGKFSKLYTVELKEGQTYRIYMKGEADVDAFVRLEDANGKLVVEDEFGEPNESGVKHIPDKTATFRIIATTFKGGMTGKYLLSITQDDPKVAVTKDARLIFQKGQPTIIPSFLANTDPKDTKGKFYKAYVFDGVAGKTYRLELAGKSGLEVLVRLEDGMGVTVKEEESFDEKQNVSRLTFKVPQSGTYKAIATTFKPGLTGNFTLTASEEGDASPSVPVGKAEPLTFGKSVQGKITADDPTNNLKKHFKAYFFLARAGKTYSFEMKGQGGLDPEMRVEDATGNTVKNEDFVAGMVSRLNFAPPQPGAFRLVATTFKAGMTGDYTLSAAELDIKPPAVVAMPTFQKVTVAEVVGQLTDDDGVDKDGKRFKVYTFTAQPDKLYRIEMNGRTFDAQLRLEDEKGMQIKPEDFFDGRFSQLFVQPGKGGVLRVIASSSVANQKGTFSLAITELLPMMAPPEAITFERVSRVNGKLTNQDGVDNQGRFYKAYTVKTQPGMFYRCEMAGSGMDAFLRLEDDKGNPIKNEDFGDGRISRLDFKADKAASFRLIATTFKPGQVGEYALQIAESDKTSATPISKALPLKFVEGKATVDGSLTAQDAKDVLGKYFKTYELPPGKSYQIALAGKGGFDPFVRVVDGAGKILKEEEEGDGKVSKLTFVAAGGGVFRVIATSFKAGMTGDYTLTVALGEAKAPKDDKKNAKPPKELNTKPFKLDNGKDIFDDALTVKDSVDALKKHFKAFVFYAEKGKTYRFEMAGKGGLDPLVRVEDTKGKAVKDEDFGDGKMSRVYFTPGEAGAFRVVATSFKPGMKGDFTLSAVVVEVKPAIAIALTLDKGKAVVASALGDADGTLPNGNKLYKEYVLTAEAGKAYKIDLSSKAFDAYLYLNDDNGKLIDQNDDNGESLDSRIIFKADKAGKYRIQATSLAGGAGAFTLTVAEFTPKEPKVAALKLELGKAAVTDSLTADDGQTTQGKYYKVYTLQAEAGKSYRVELIGGAKTPVDPFIRLEDDKGKHIMDEEFGDGKLSRLVFKAEKAGTYRIIASTFKPGMTGTYTLSARQIDVKDATPIAVKLDKGSAVISGELTRDDGLNSEGKYYKVYTFQADKGKAYRCELTGGKSALDPHLRIQDAQGQHVKEEDFGDGKLSRAFLKAEKAATYRVVASTFKPGMVGDFKLTIDEVEQKDAKPIALKFDKGRTSVDSELTKDDAMLFGSTKHYKDYTFLPEAGKNYRIDLHSKDFDAYLFLKDDAGKTLVENDDNGESLDSRIVWKADKAGTYHILATSLGDGRTGKFLLTVAEPNAADKLMARANDFGKATPAERKEIVAELQKHFASLGGKLTPNHARLAMGICVDLEDGDKKVAAAAYTGFGALFAAAADPAVARQGKTLAGAGRRLGLVGNTMLIKGTTVDGKDFDLAKLKGKVVLVDFWATWCGPCRAELPNVKKLHAKYHADGFEVIGISLDNAKADLTSFLEKEKLPWTSIFEKANDLADDYGVFAIPLAILVGRDGRVLSLDARGPELDRLLEKEFGKK